MIFNIWLTAVCIQVVITVTLALQFARYSEGTSKKKVSFSIIVAAHNELKNLKILLPKLIDQVHHDFEIIISLDRCTDKSKEFLEKMNCEKLKIVNIDHTVPGFNPKKYALSCAIDRSEKEWLVFTDADCVPSGDKWLGQIQSRTVESTSIIIGYSPFVKSRKFIHHFIQFEGFVTAFNYLSMALMNKPYMAVGRNMAINRAFFKKGEGYEKIKSVTGGDDDLFIQSNATSKNTSTLMGSESLIFSYPKDSWREYIIQKTRHLSVSNHYSFSDQIFHLLFNGSLLLTWFLIPFLSFEFILPVILFYLSVKVIGYRFAVSKMGAGFNYILLPLVDFMYAVLIPIIAVRSKLVKDIRWKN